MITCLFTDSDCMGKYKETIVPKGIVIHSTGVNQKKIARYAQPSKNDPKRDEIIDVLGKNKYNNHWNRPGVKKAVHYIVGCDKNDNVTSVKCLPHNIAAWGVGSGKNGSYNYEPTGHIQIETCEDNLKNKVYFDKCLDEIIRLCVNICKEEKLSPDTIVSHKECHKLGYGSNHADIDHWLKKYNMTMNDLRNAVKEKLSYNQLTGIITANGITYRITGNIEPV